MKKYIFVIGLLVTIITTAQAQLKVDSLGKVKIASNMIAANTHLVVGNHPVVSISDNVGIIGTTTPMSGKNNVGVYGITGTNNGIASGKYYGVLGITNPVNPASGVNYGVCGMIGFTGNHYGGAGIYGTNYTYYLSCPSNIQGDYAGYFAGPVNLTGYLTAPSMYIPADSRLSENVVSINERGEEANTLDNLLAMNVIEFNMKNRISDEMPDDVKQDETGEVREAYEYLKKDEMKMCARRHFGIDAEELKKVYPDLVLEGQDGYLAVNYVELVPLLIRSIQELSNKVTELESAGMNKTRAFDNPDGDIAAPSPTGNVLYQNTPNPFREQTVIRFRLADGVQNAAICIFDLNGRMLKKLPVTADMESVTVNGYELGEGLFLYSLIVNGQEIDTKRMLITN